MKRTTQYLLALLIGVLASCGSEEVKPTGENELLVSIDDMQTRTSLYENDSHQRVKTKWEIGDKIKLYSVHGSEVYTATFSCLENGQISRFTLVSQDDEFDVSEFAAAYYPADNAKGYDKTEKKITATIPASQTYAKESFGSGAAPMVSNVKKDVKEILFKNAFGAVCLQLFTQSSTAASNLTSITLESTSTKLNGTFQFTMSGNNSFTVTYPTTDGSTSTTLSAGSSPVAISTDKDKPTPFYVMVPGTANNELIDMTVTTNNFTYYRSSTSNNQTYASSDPDHKYNKVATNNILKMGKLEVGATQLISVGVDSWNTGESGTPTFNK